MTTAGPARGWRPILVLLAVILVVGLSAVAFAWQHSNRADHTSQASCPKTGLVGHLDLVAANGSARPEQLSQAADILRKRLGIYGCGSGSGVSVEGDRLKVSASQDAVSHLDALITPGDLQFREVLETTAAGQCLPVTTIVPADAALTACSNDGSEQFSLAPAKVVGTDVKGAKAQQDQQLGQWQIIISFTSHGQRAFTALTRGLVGKRMAIVLDGTVISAPNILEQIDGDAQISGSFTESSANALVNVLKYGALPVQLKRA